MEFFLVRIFPYSVWIRKDTRCLSVFSPQAGKYGPEKTPYLDNFHAVSPFPQDFFWMDLHERFQNGSFNEKIFVGKIFKMRKNYLPMSLFPIKMQVCMSLKRELQCRVLLLKHYLSVPLVPLLLFFRQSCFTFQYIQFFTTPCFYFLAALISVNLEKNYFVCIQFKLLFKLLFLS